MRGRIENLIKGFINNYKGRNKTKTDWDDPLVAFASAADPLFPELKTWVSATHPLPIDLLRDAKTVISYFIPFKKETVLSNRGGENSSIEWAIAYIETNHLITEVNQYLLEEFEKYHFKSILLPPTHNFDEKRLISDWSHKHIAWIAGLGKLGLHRMLITEKGCCGRLGSLVTNAPIDPNQRTDEEYCLYRYDGTCKKCAENCTFGALTFDSYDRRRCYEVCLINANVHLNLGNADVCGKCVCVVPCSFSNPIKQN